MHSLPPFRQLAAILIAASFLTSPLVATDGMNMEGYGPVATALGGASLAYDNGTATVEKHLNAGLGWKFDERSSFDASFTYGFKAEETNG